MSFRNRLTAFFVLIVIVPLVTVALLGFRLISDSETGKADARLAQGQRAAIGLLRRELDRASGALRRIGADRLMLTALRSDDFEAARTRAGVLLGRTGAKRVVLTRGGRRLVDVGSPSAIAPAARRLVSNDGRAVAKLEVSTITAGEYVAETRQLTRFETVVRAGAATLAGPASGRLADLPDAGEVRLDGRTFRAATFGAPGFEGRRLRISVLSDHATTSSGTGQRRWILGGVLLGFLLLAFVFANAISRALQSQISRFLEAARRIGGGDFSTAVPVQGDDEFAALGEQFNKMSQQLESRLAELEREQERLQQSIRRTGEAFASNLDRDALMEISVPTVVDAVGADAGRVTRRDAAGHPLEQRAAVGPVDRFADAIRAAERAAMSSRECEVATVDGRSALAYPMIDSDNEQRVLGLVSVARDAEPFDDDERARFCSLAAQARVSIENVDLHQVVRRQAVTDELTGLFNLRRFQEVITGEVERAKRFDQPLGLVMLDIDNFKRVNDTYGHQQGDMVLREVARVLRESSREIDEPARYGGEELAVALPQTDLDGAYRLAERVRSSVEALKVERVDGQGTLRITASLGVAALPESAMGKTELIAAADAALYEAKRGGKNQTVRSAPATTKSGRGG